MPEERWPADPEWCAGVRKPWHGEHGDRRPELAFIGIGMDEPRLRAALDACPPTSAAWQAEPGGWACLSARLPRRGEAA